MKSKEEIAKDLGISRKTLYNYMNELKIKELNLFLLELNWKKMRLIMHIY